MTSKYLSAAEVTRFRDNAWIEYHTNPAFLDLIESKFGSEARIGVEDLSKVKLRQRILGDS